MKSALLSILLLGALAPADAAAQGSAPRLEHGAPWLGGELSISLVEAPPASAVRLFESDAAGSQQTAYGLLELDRAALRVVAVGSTTPEGRFDAQLSIPLDPALAETEAHYQALVADPAAAGGWVLSPALHLRRLGARFYAGSLGTPGAGPGGLSIVSAVTGALVATVDYGVPDAAALPSADARPVFSDDSARGAVVAPSGDLLLFDPFFGGVLAAVPVPGASRKLAATSGGSVVVALEPSGPGGAAVLRAFDMATGAALGSLALPRASSGAWCWSPARDEVYVVERDAAGDRGWLRRVGLQGLEDLGAIAIGAGHAVEVLALAVHEDSVLLTSFDDSGCISVGSGDGLVARVDYSADPPRVASAPTGARVTHLVPAAELGGLFAFENLTPCWGPGFRLSLRRLDQLGSEQSFLLPAGLDDGVAGDLCWDPDQLWLAMPTTYDGNQALLWFHSASATWTTFSLPPPGPIQVEVVRDALVHTGGLLERRFVPDPPHFEGRLTFVDPTTGPGAQEIVRDDPESLLGVGLP